MLARIALALLVGPLAVASVCRANNIVQGASVTLNGAYGQLRTPTPWYDATTYPVAAGSTITDGVFLGNGTEWQDGTVWWDALLPESANNNIVIDLGGIYSASSVAIEADNNDNYLIEFHDLATDTWQGWAYANTGGSGGMLTRAGGLPAVVTDKFRLTGFNGDQYYSISEFQVDGVAVPVPAALPGGLVLIGCGLAARVLRRRAVAG